MGEVKPISAYLGLNLDSIIAEVKPGQLTYALNAQVGGFEGNSITYQNEPSDEFCFQIPEGYKIIGTHQILEIETVIYWLSNITTGQSEIGKVVNNNCIYQTIINASCLNLSINHPILKAVHKITNCTVEVYWTDGFNPRRWIDLNNLPFIQVVEGTNTDPCNIVTTSEIDCNKLNIQPNFAIPVIDYVQIESEGSTVAGTYQFAFQYCNSLGDEYTSYYSITDPIPINDPFKVTPDFNYSTAKSIQIEISNIDTTGLFQYFNVAVIKTINNITSVDLVATYQIEGPTQKILYTGQSKAGITLTIDDIFEKFPIFDTAGDLTTVQDILVWDDLTTTERLTYQDIANQISTQWVSWRIPPVRNGFKDEINAAERRGYMRDEVYPLDMVVIRTNGYQTDRFPIPGRIALPSDLTLINNGDTQFGETICDTPESLPRWKVYNTGSVVAFDPQYLANQNDPCYEGPYQYGTMGYFESTETYPCNEAVWGNLQGQPIRHHKFPDSAITHHYDASGNIYPLGVKIDMQQIYNLFRASGLTDTQKSSIAAIKIVRGNRANSKSIIAKGLLYNVGTYTKDNTNYYYPNYPYNDLRPDPFIKVGLDTPIGILIASNFTEVQNIGSIETSLYNDQIEAKTFVSNNDIVNGQYSGFFTATPSNKELRYYVLGQPVFDSGPIIAPSGTSWNITVKITRTSSASLTVNVLLALTGAVTRNIQSTTVINTVDFTIPIEIKLTALASIGGIPPNTSIGQTGDIVGESEQVRYQASTFGLPTNNNLDGFNNSDAHERFTFHSPDTSFFQPFLGNILKLETAEYGSTRSHFVQVKDHSKYRFPSLDSYITSLAVGVIIGFASSTIGVSTQAFDGSAAFTAFTLFNDLIYRLLPKKNFAYSFNSLGNYHNFSVVPNDVGNKIRQIEIGQYLIPGVQGVGDTNPVNNYQREGSIYLKVNDQLPFPSTLPNVPADTSRFTLGEVGCDTGFQFRSISSYYGSIKNIVPDQYGQIYSYEAIDTGFQELINLNLPFDTTQRFKYVFGGDTFINKFGFKRKLPFFVDNRVGFPDEADVFYDELGNIAFPTYWFSTDIQQGDGGAFSLGSLFGVKVNNFDCKGNNFFYDSGKIYLFAYGIVNFYVESEVNVDYRQAYNNKEGDYWPHVSGDVPDDWFQEINVPINFDNTYTYNKTYSKQNIENVFTTLPIDFIPGQLCTERYPNKAIYSDPQQDVVNYKKNNWLIYRPVSYFDFPLNYGKLTSLEGIENKAVLARFENKSMIYNALLTINTSNPQAAFIGNSTLFKSSPPIDFVETDLGYAGAQHKFFLKTEYGNISIDAKRGQVLIIGSGGPKGIGDIGLKQFFTNNLNFQMLAAFPNYNIDNNFKGVGLHGVFDTKYERFIITKLDYKPLNSAITYDITTDTFHLNGMTITLGDPLYFCNISWTLSFNFLTQSWISFHTYQPNFYVGVIDRFYSGYNTLSSVWRHNNQISSYNSFTGNIQPYILEYPINYKYQDEIIQSVKDYTKVNNIISTQSFVQTNEIFFNKAIVYNDQQCSGILNLVPKPPNNLAVYSQYPKYNVDSKDILFTKSDDFYNYNGFWDIVRDYTLPLWQSSCQSLSIDKQLIITNLDYTLRSFKKYTIRAKDCKIRHILDNRSDSRLTSQFVAPESQISYK